VSVQKESAQPTGGPTRPKAFSSARTGRRGRVVSTLAAAAIASGLLIGTTACGAGQISQTANQAPAINGNEIDAGSMALRNVHIIFPKDGSTEEFVDGGPLEMAFLIANMSPDTSDKLESITFADGPGKVTIEGDTAIGPAQALRAGEPSLLLETSAEPEGPSETPITVTVTGAQKKLTPGLTIPMVFSFENAGETTIDVPIDAGAILPRQDKPRGVDADHVEEHH
jgi:hypothetical protein